jgi:hypothetical protein
VAVFSEGHANHDIIEERRIREFMSGICKIFTDGEFELVGAGPEFFVVEQRALGATIVVGYGRSQKIAAVVESVQADPDAILGDLRCSGQRNPEISFNFSGLQVKPK